MLATASPIPVIDDEAIGRGAHICGVGACRPDQREMPTAVVARSRMFVDSRAGALKEAGDILLPILERAIDERHIAGELGELALGRVAGRQSETDLTIFKSLGMAVEDVVTARLVVERAKAAGLGQSFELS